MSPERKPGKVRKVPGTGPRPAPLSFTLSIGFAKLPTPSLELPVHVEDDKPETETDR